MTPSALESLRQWFRQAQRIFPWSETHDPYAVWISEIMLQQTVVSAAIAPYSAWMARWPHLRSLAAATEDEVLRAWEGLGYPSRAQNLHRTAQLLAKRGEDTLPDDEDALLALPGIGAYTAAAIQSFAYHKPVLTLDANLKRVFQRLDAEALWTPGVESRWRTAWPNLVNRSSREINQAFMQLGQIVCRARQPQCAQCPLAADCLAHRRKLTASIPAAKPRTVTEKTTTVVFWHRGGDWWLARPVSGRFSSLWLAPPGEPTGTRLSGRVHTYTRYRDRLTPYVAAWPGTSDPPLPEGWIGRWATPEEATGLGMVSVYRKIFDEAIQPVLLDEVVEPAAERSEGKR